MNIWQKIKQPPWRTVVPALALLGMVWLGYWLWRPGIDVTDGRHDLRHNAIWLGHGWLGDDAWFKRNGKIADKKRFRDASEIRQLAQRLHQHHITDVFPHLCPANADGSLPAVNADQLNRFLDEFADFRVMPWVGGPNGETVFLDRAGWRAGFVRSVVCLMTNYPRLAGFQINIEPLPNGDTNFLVLLDELRAAIPHAKAISVAAYPPPTVWHRHADVHWDMAYYQAVAGRSDQMAVMSYDAAQRIPKCYRQLMCNWTRESLAWSGKTPVLLGLPTYRDEGVDYHDWRVENLTNALMGVHGALAAAAPPANYQGVAIYCEWETTAEDWQYFDGHFLAQDGGRK